MVSHVIHRRRNSVHSAEWSCVEFSKDMEQRVHGYVDVYWASRKCIPNEGCLIHIWNVCIVHLHQTLYNSTVHWISPRIIHLDFLCHKWNLHFVFYSLNFILFLEGKQSESDLWCAIRNMSKMEWMCVLEIDFVFD